VYTVAFVGVIADMKVSDTGPRSLLCTPMYVLRAKNAKGKGKADLDRRQPDNSVGTVTRLRIGESAFSTAARPTLEPIQQPVKTYRDVEDLYPGCRGSLPGTVAGAGS
jgi:hypothetical protein